MHYFDLASAVFIRQQNMSKMYMISALRPSVATTRLPLIHGDIAGLKARIGGAQSAAMGMVHTMVHIASLNHFFCV
jgi:hypothetical protein